MIDYEGEDGRRRMAAPWNQFPWGGGGTKQARGPGRREAEEHDVQC